MSKTSYIYVHAGRSFAVEKSGSGWLASARHLGGPTLPGAPRMVAFTPAAGSYIEVSKLKKGAWIACENIGF